MDHRGPGLGRRDRAGSGAAAKSVDVRIDDEWSFAETLRHLVHAIDVWLGKGVLGLEEADFHPLGLGHGSSLSEARSY